MRHWRGQKRNQNLGRNWMATIARHSVSGSGMQGRREKTSPSGAEVRLIFAKAVCL
jgi:hypothetical protein